MKTSRGRSGALVISLAVGAASLLPATALPPPISVELVPLSGDVVPQGEPFRFRVVLRNGTAGRVEGALELELAKPGADPQVVADRWLVSVEPGMTYGRDSELVTSQWFVERGAFELTASAKLMVYPAGTGVPFAPPASLRFGVSPPRVVVPTFADVTVPAGIAVDHPIGLECNDYGAGAAWGDFDGDGHIDLYLPQREGRARLWISDGAGRFVDRAVQAGVANEGSVGIGAVGVDYDEDGDTDLYVVNYGTNRLYRNDGSGRFADVAASAGVADDGPGTSASWADYDGDGLLDMYLTNYGRRECFHEMDFTPARDRLYHNEGDGTFTDRTALLTPPDGVDGLGFQAAWFDYDGDGDPDLYLGNDRVGPDDRPNVLWRNDGAAPDGTWRFTDVSAATGTGLGMNTMGLGVGDHDRDGDLDIAISNMGSQALLANDGSAFTDRAAAAGIARPMQQADAMSVTWGLGFADLNNDGWEDLYVAAGVLEISHREAQPNEVFAGLGGGRFADLSALSGADDPGMSRGVAFADYDRDGRVDVYVVPHDGTPRLYRNVTARSGHWLEVRAVGTRSPRDACGATARARIGKVTLVRQVLCGSVGLSSGSDPVLHFGLGAAKSLRSLEILWPSGERQVLRRVRADRLVTVVEPA